MEMQINIKMTCYLTPVRTITKKTKIISVGEDVEERNPAQLWFIM
jgi:hypothetical protein